MVDVSYREVPPQDPLPVTGSVSITGTVTSSEESLVDFGIVTPGAGNLSPRPRALFFSAPGNLTMEDDGANSIVIAVVASQWIQGISPLKITAWSGTAGAVSWYA